MINFKNLKKNLIILLSFIIIIFIMVTITYPHHLYLFIQGFPGSEEMPWGDAWHYYSMAISFPFNSTADAPFCYRILTPLILYIIPLDPKIGFFWFTLICTILTSFLFYYYLKQFNFNTYYTFIGTIIFIISVPNFYLLFYTMFVDPLNYFLFLFGCIVLLNIERGKIKGLFEIILMSSILAIGILNKETIIILILIYCMITKGHKGYRIVKSIIISIPPAIIYILLRSLIPYSGYTYEGIWIIHHIINWQNTIFNILIPFILLWILLIPSVYKSNFMTIKNCLFLKYSSLIIPIFLFQIIFEIGRAHV